MSGNVRDLELARLRDRVAELERENAELTIDRDSLRAALRALAASAFRPEHSSPVFRVIRGGRA